MCLPLNTTAPTTKKWSSRFSPVRSYPCRTTSSQQHITLHACRMLFLRTRARCVLVFSPHDSLLALPLRTAAAVAVHNIRQHQYLFFGHTKARTRHTHNLNALVRACVHRMQEHMCVVCTQHTVHICSLLTAHTLYVAESAPDVVVLALCSQACAHTAHTHAVSSQPEPAAICQHYSNGFNGSSIMRPFDNYN